MNNLLYSGTFYYAESTVNWFEGSLYIYGLQEAIMAIINREPRGTEIISSPCLQWGHANSLAPQTVFWSKKNFRSMMNQSINLQYLYTTFQQKFTKQFTE